MIGGSNKLLGFQEVADLLGIPKRTVEQKWREWEWNGLRIGRYVKFREREIEAWITKQAA